MVNNHVLQVAAMKQMLAPQRAHERVLNEIVGGFRIARERAGESPKGGDQGLEAAANSGHGGTPWRSSTQAILIPLAKERERRSIIPLRLEGPRHACHSRPRFQALLATRGFYGGNRSA